MKTDYVENIDANIVQFLRVIKKFGLMSQNTYHEVALHLMFNGHNKKDKWRQANWKEYLKNG